MGMQLNTGDTGKAVTASADGSLYANILGDGCYVLSNGSQFTAAIQSNNKIKISDGDLMMQGRHAWIEPSDSQIMTIDNNASNTNRIDLIVARYTKDSAGKEAINLLVIKGTATASTPAEPSFTSGDIRAGATQKDFPLYAVRLTGLNITSVTKKFTVLDTMSALQTAISQLNSNLLKYKQCEYTVTLSKKQTQDQYWNYAAQVMLNEKSDFPKNHIATVPLVAYYGSSGFASAVIGVGDLGTSVIVSGDKTGKYFFRVGYFYTD